MSKFCSLLFLLLISTCDRPVADKTYWYIDEYLAMLDSLNYNQNVSILSVSSFLPKEKLTYTRVSAAGYYLSDAVQPDSVAFTDGTPVIFNFFKEATTEERRKAKEKLYAKNIIDNNMAYSRKTNYPEWIHFKGEYLDTVIRDTHYKPIEELVARLSLQ